MRLVALIEGVLVVMCPMSWDIFSSLFPFAFGFFCGGFSLVWWGDGVSVWRPSVLLAFGCCMAFLRVICAVLTMRWQFLAESFLPYSSSYLTKWSSFIGIWFDWLIYRLLKDMRQGFAISVIQVSSRRHQRNCGGSSAILI